MVFDYLYTALIGYEYKDYAAKNFRSYKKETVASRLAYSKVPFRSSYSISFVLNAVANSRPNIETVNRLVAGLG